MIITKIPDSVVYIGAYVFSKCVNLSYLRLPKNPGCYMNAIFNSDCSDNLMVEAPIEFGNKIFEMNSLCEGLKCKQY